MASHADITVKIFLKTLEALQGTAKYFRSETDTGDPVPYAPSTIGRPL
jgi:hypothetical protein